ncbi:MAG: hypothetical protein HYR63_10960 [Proteobacteria bacterium]|nr:hypothetical protein [Pseudomonadota bacterium]MBI3498257.1 hypothetical protein [Pseudomonadota bacterium]
MAQGTCSRLGVAITTPSGLTSVSMESRWSSHGTPSAAASSLAPGAGSTMATSAAFGSA